MNAINKIELRNVSYQYENGYRANENLNLCIHQGEAIAIVGQNGAGKTTAVKMMNGLYKPSEGCVLVNGIDTKTKTTAQIASMVGYVFQNPDDQIFNRSVRDEIEYMLRYLELDKQEIKIRLEEAVELTGIKKYLNNNPFDIPYSTRKFVSIAAILAIRPRYIILDEPTAGQDLLGIKILKKLISHLRENVITVITITHDMEFVAENFDRVVAMADRHIVMDASMLDVFSNFQVLEQCKIKQPSIARLAYELGYGTGIVHRRQLRELINTNFKKE